MELASVDQNVITVAHETVRYRTLRRCQMDLDQLGGESWRTARELRADAASCSDHDFRTIEGNPYSQYRFPDDSRMCRRARGTAEVHAQIAMPVIVPTVAEAVRRIGTQPYDEGEGRNKCDQAIAELTRAQGVEPLFKGQSSLACESPASNNSCHNAR